MKLWSKHWLTLQSRRFGFAPLRQEAPLILLSIEEGSLGERDIPVKAKPILRHYMSNIFLYLMPEETEEGSVHGWELKLGFTLEEAKTFLEELQETITLCEKRREERHRSFER